MKVFIPGDLLEFACLCGSSLIYIGILINGRFVQVTNQILTRHTEWTIELQHVQITLETLNTCFEQEKHNAFLNDFLFL